MSITTGTLLLQDETVSPKEDIFYAGSRTFGMTFVEK